MTDLVPIAPVLGIDVGAVAAAAVVRLHPISTLVVSRDLAFRQRASSVLAGLGAVTFAVGSLDRDDDIVAFVVRERPNVVVLDTTACEQSVGRIVNELSEVAPRAGVVLVANRTDRCQRIRAIDKWGWAEELLDAVRAAYGRGNPLMEEPVHDRQSG
jgi:FixJ family two-component response regulator